MKPKFTLSLIAVLFLCGLCAYTTASSSIYGTITDEQHEAVQGVTVIVKHLPTSTYRGTLSLADGTYNLKNLRGGGPYLMTLSYTGFKTVYKDSILIKDGQKLNLNFEMQH
ncbi:MAG: carboxypeptidase-like regulatory domain-containing protein [Bacteroidota bacterium]